MIPVALVVDDSMLIRYTVTCFLEERGYRVESATNGLEALELLKKVRPELIVTDLQMPKMAGPEFIEKLKADSGLAGVPVIVVAGRQGNERIQAGADFTIYKDIDVQGQLEKALETLSRRPVQRQGARA